MFPTTTVTPRRRSSPIVADKKQRDELLSVSVDFANLFERKTPEQVSQALDRFLSGDDGSSADDEGEVKYAGTSSKSAVDDAFDDLLK
jgi:hypothetical protein